MADRTRAVYELARRLARERGGRLIIVEDAEELEYVLRHGRKRDVVLLDGDLVKDYGSAKERLYEWIPLVLSDVTDTYGYDALVRWMRRERGEKDVR